MTMALKLTVEDINTVPEPQRGEYTQKEGKWHLGVDGIEDTTGLKKPRDDLLAEKKEAQRKAKEAEDAARKAGNTAALDKSWGEKPVGCNGIALQCLRSR